MKESQRSKKRSKIFTSLYAELKKGKSPAQICEDLNFSKQKLNYYLSFLKEKGIIEKKGYGVWEISKKITEDQLKKQVKKRSKKFSSLGLIDKPRTNLHALQISFPILEGKILDKDWEIKNKLNNWIPKYKGLKTLGGLTIRNNNNKSLTVWAKARDIKTLEEIDNLAFKIRSFVFDYFKKKQEVILDVFNCETKNLDIATEDKVAEGMRRKGEKFLVKFDKKAEKIFEKDKLQSKAIIDGSPFRFSAETNDKEWKRAYLTMPFSIQSLNQSMFLLQDYNRNLKLHKQVQEENLKLNKENLKTQKEMQELLKQISKKL